MKYQVVIYNGWSKYIFYYHSENIAKASAWIAMQDKKEVHIFQQIENGWKEIKLNMEV